MTGQLGTPARMSATAPTARQVPLRDDVRDALTLIGRGAVTITYPPSQPPYPHVRGSGTCSTDAWAYVVLHGLAAVDRGTALPFASPHATASVHRHPAVLTPDGETALRAGAHLATAVDR